MSCSPLVQLLEARALSVSGGDGIPSCSFKSRSPYTTVSPSLGIRRHVHCTLNNVQLVFVKRNTLSRDTLQLLNGDTSM